MPQTYREADNAALNEPLLGHSRPQNPNGRATPKDGKASLASSIGNLANTILGTGMLSFPLAMASGGIIPGVITCIFSGCTAAFGLYLLSRCAAKAPHRKSSFFAISQMTFPSASVWFDTAIAIKCFGVSISYLIIIKGLMPSVVAALYHVLLPSDPPEWALSGRVWISLFTVILVPLCFLRDLHSLRHTSYVALFSVAYLVTVVVICYIFPPKAFPTKKLQPMRVTESAEEDDDVDYDHGVHDEASPVRHTLLTAVIVICGFTTAYFVSSLQIVLSFVGSTGSTTISFILPGLFFSRLFQDDPKERMLVNLARGLTLYGCFIFVFCLGFNLYEISK
ncbi:hypothetical protein FRC19_003013 [Serendipita sp. 401]|nr:hypothetical protein FRC19_003013 [Serendipita sp. 401]